ncbi:FGGY-family carbohydrate kinase [Mesorhizobium koreense]|uniref:FGGY-family carbohydrate kinase n=1 Tax=Mesorhizobium koreense TaxID=3074855 RepID=UPI00287B87FC|nr:FGGY-family carbohydrate kinase [Mesorhizobium sp. WR6]
MAPLVCAVDVGTTSARAAILDSKGRLLGRVDHAIAIRRVGPDIAEHASEDIWHAVCHAVHGARAAAGARPEEIAGIAFDATCSLVIRDGEGEPLALSSSEGQDWDTIAWLDHRAQAEAAECSATGHAVLDTASGVMSPEMQIPKLMWLKRNRPDIWAKTGHLFDLADFLTWKATGGTERSHCTLACKWTFNAGSEPGWNTGFLDAVGLSDLLERGGLPEWTRPVGSDLGPLTVEAAEALGLTPQCRVAAGMIDAYAGALGVLGGYAGNPAELSGRAALVAGTSSCVMLFSPEPARFAGAWGPYHGVALPDLWASEGGQSATGALLDHVIRWHGAEPNAATHGRIVARIAELRAAEGEEFAAGLHVLPDFHGNRSPHADPRALGVISGLALDTSFDGLCRLYWRMAVAIAYGVRQIVEAIREGGHPVERLHLAGGHLRNQLLTDLYTSAIGCTLVEPAAEDAMLLGTGMAAAAAAGLHPGLPAAAVAMRQGEIEHQPDPAAFARFDRDYRIFLEMQRHRQALEAIV